MGWVKERVGRDGQTMYTAVYRDLQGRERSAGTWRTEKRAVREWHRAEEELNAGRVADPKRGRQTLRQYVEKEWLPNHLVEARTRENYTYLLNKYVLPELGHYRMIELLPSHVREWVGRMQSTYNARPPTIREAKVVLDAILTTALNEQVTVLHAGRGVKTPPVVKKPRGIFTAHEYSAVRSAIIDETMQLMVETDIESGLRWGELTELRPKDLDLRSGILTVSRVVVELRSKDRPDGVRFVVKHYPKDREWRRLKLAPHIVEKIQRHIYDRGLQPDDLLFALPTPTGPTSRGRPASLPDPETLGLTEPNAKGRQYRHGTLTAYQAAPCRCQHCRDAVAAYRAVRRAYGKDTPRSLRTVTSDGHIPNGWFRTHVWNPALEAAKLPFRVTPHGLRHAHASWLLAGGADLQVVKERLGHGSITTTEKYLHTLPGAGDAALSALDAVRGVGNTDATPVREPTDTTGAPIDQRDAELAEMRQMVAKLSQMLGSLGSTT
jgi:integrase